MNKSLLFIFFVSISFSELLHPENFSEQNSTHILFKWDQEQEVYDYNIQISSSINFNNNSIIRDTIVNKPIYIEKELIDWDNLYFWRVRTIDQESQGNWIETRRFYTSENKVNVDLNILNQELIQEGLTIIGDDGNLLTAVYDSNGRCIWHDGDLNVMLNNTNEYGQLFGFSGNNWPNKSGIEYNYFNDIVWQGPSDIYIDEHEIKQIPNQNYMGFVEEFNLGPIPLGEWTNIYQSLGYEADGESYEFNWKGNRLVEWDRFTKQELWSWNPFDFFSFEEYDQYGGTWYYSFDVHDWMHSNAFYFDTNDNSIYMSHRHLSRITKISYPEGQIEWVMGLPCPYMNLCEQNICSDLKFSFQHHISVLDNGNLIFFDNGNLSELLNDLNDPVSRVIEVDVTDNNNCEIIWEYTLPEELFGPFHGSVQKLSNGNYLINTAGMYNTNGHGGTIIEVTENKNIISIAEPETSWGDNLYSYRAYRIPSIYPNAFSIVFNNLKIINDQNIIDSDSRAISFNIYNESGFNQPYTISLNDLENQLFNNIDTTIYINAYDNINFEINANNTEFSSTNIDISIYPFHHQYDTYNNTFQVNLNNINLGDLNEDFDINIQDIIIIIQLILNDEFNYLGDLNMDLELNVIDVVQIVNVILN